MNIIVMTTILAIDTSINFCFVALLKNKKVNFIKKLCLHKDRAEHILYMIDEILMKHNLKLKDLSAFAVGIGPGSFSGVRFSVSVIYGLSLVNYKPIVCVSTLEALANYTWRRKKIKRVLVAVDARSKNVYWANYYRSDNGYWCLHSQESVLELNSVVKELSYIEDMWFPAGNAWSAYIELKNLLVSFGFKIPENELYIEDIAILALQKFESKKYYLPDETIVEPMYLKNLY